MPKIDLRNHVITYSIQQTVEKTQAMAQKVVESMNGDKKHQRAGKDIVYNCTEDENLTLTVKKLSNTTSCIVLKSYPNLVTKPAKGVVIVIGGDSTEAINEEEKYNEALQLIYTKFDSYKEAIEKALEGIDHNTTEKYVG